MAKSTKVKLLVSYEDAREKINHRIQKGKEFLDRNIISWDSLEAAQNDYRSWNSYNSELLKQIFDDEKISDEYLQSVMFGVIGGERELSQEVKEFNDDVKEKLHRLESIIERLELYPSLQTETKTKKTQQITSNKIFIVHGRDEAAREKVARFLENIGHKPIILHEQASSGRTIIEKLEYYSDVDFAIILLTPDDVGALATDKEKLNFRARQNVVLELGYFISKLGRNKVCALHKGKIELPSDYLGVIYINMDDQEGWRFLLAKEMKAVGFEVDLNLLS